MVACQEGHEHVLEALLKGGATVDMQDEVVPAISNSRLSPLLYMT